MRTYRFVQEDGGSKVREVSVVRGKKEKK